MQRVVNWMRETMPHVQHVAHAAGISGLALLQDLTAPELDGVVNIKVHEALTP